MEKVETGQLINAITFTGGVVVGVVAAQGEVFLQQGGIQKFYKVCIVGDKYIDLLESELISIKPLVLGRKKQCIEDFAKEYGIQCFDDEGKILSNSKIMAKIIYDDKWDELSEDKKKEFVDCIGFSNEDIVEIINVLLSLKYDNQKMHQRQIKALDISKELLTIYQEIREKVPECAPMYKYIYNQLGIEKLINSI